MIKKLVLAFLVFEFSLFYSGTILAQSNTPDTDYRLIDEKRKVGFLD